MADKTRFTIFGTPEGKVPIPWVLGQRVRWHGGQPATVAELLLGFGPDGLYLDGIQVAWDERTPEGLPGEIFSGDELLGLEVIE